MDIPEQEMRDAASAATHRLAPAIGEASSHAREGFRGCDEILHPDAASKLQAIFLKLASRSESGAEAAEGLGAGLDDVAAKFGEVDRLHRATGGGGSSRGGVRI